MTDDELKNLITAYRDSVILSGASLGNNNITLNDLIKLIQLVQTNQI